MRKNIAQKFSDFAIKNCIPIVLSRTYSSHQRGIVQLPLSNIHLACNFKILHQKQYNFFAKIKYQRNKIDNLKRFLNFEFY